MRINGGCGSGGRNCRVGTEGRFLLFLVLLAKVAISGLVDGPSHVVFAPVKGEFTLFLLLGVATFGWDLLPGLILLLLLLVRCVLLVSCLTALLVIAFCNLSQLGIELELALERLDLSGHSHDLFVVLAIFRSSSW